MPEVNSKRYIKLSEWHNELNKAASAVGDTVPNKGSPFKATLTGIARA